MQIQDFLEPSAIRLDLGGSTREAVLREMVALLSLQPRASEALVHLALRREQLGSTGFGLGIAIPHARSLVVHRLRLAFGRHPAGIEYAAMDRAPVRVFFLIVAPPHEVSNQYLPILGKVAQLCQHPGVPARLANLPDPAALFALLNEYGL